MQTQEAPTLALVWQYGALESERLAGQRLAGWLSETLALANRWFRGQDIENETEEMHAYIQSLVALGMLIERHGWPVVEDEK